MLIKEESTRRLAASRSKKMYFIAMLFVLLGWLLLSRGFDILTIDRAEGTTRESGELNRAYSNGIADLMARHEYFYQQASTMLALYSEYCSQVEAEVGSPAGALRARNEALCSIFTEAADMVGAYSRRLGEGSVAPQALFHFDLLESGEEKNIGPFLSRSECSVIAARLVQSGEQVTSCLSYEEWHYELFFAKAGD